MTRHRTHSREETVALGRSLAASLRPGDVIALFGTLGSGKTQFVTGVCEGLGTRGHVSSPTFTIVNEYPAPFGTVVHIDLYRIRSRAEIAELALEEYFDEHCICLIEWPESIRDLLPHRHVAVTIAAGDEEQERDICIQRSQEEAG